MSSFSPAAYSINAFSENAFSFASSGADTTPNDFPFAAQTGVALSSVITSNTVTISGINSAAFISIVGGTYSVNGGAYTSSSGSINNGDTVSVQLTSSASYLTAVSAVLTISGVSGTFTATTLSSNVSPLRIRIRPK